MQSGVIRKLATDRSGVFIGRVADYILREHPRRVSIFVAADTEDRAKRIMEKEKTNRKNALRIIEEGDNQRANYYNFYSSGTWGSADNYDLCINSSALGIEATAEFILQFISQKLNLTLPADSSACQVPAPEVF